MIEKTMFQRNQLRNDYVDAVDELIKSRNADEAIRRILHSIVFLFNCRSAVIALTNQKPGELLSVAASVGAEFHETNTHAAITSAAKLHSWQTFSEKFECTYSSPSTGQPESFCGFPIYKAGQPPFGFIAIPSECATASDFDDKFIQSLMSLLAHRLNEYDLLLQVDPLEHNEQLDIIKHRGIRFPHHDDFFAKVRHDINGLLAASSLQAQMLSSSSTGQSSKEVGFDRLMSSISKIESQLEIQENGISVLLGSEPDVSFRKCLDVALKTFSIAMPTAPMMTVNWQSDDQFIAVRGSVLHWILHNTLRQISVVAAPSDYEAATISIDVSRSGGEGNPALDIEISAELGALGQESIARHLGQSTLSDTANRGYLSVLGHLIGLMEILGWVIRLSSHSGQLTVSASIPSIPSKR